MNKRIAAGTAVLACLCQPAPLWARTSHTVTATAETQEFSDDAGSLRTITLEYKLVNDDTTVLFTPQIGERRAPGVRATAVGGGVTLYHDWSDAVSTRTSGFIAEDDPVFAEYEFAQDVTLKVGDSTTVTVGGRLARYFGNQDVTFLSAGARQYFRFGSASYRLTHVDPEGRDPYLAHLVNLVLNDPSGAGKTQLWLSLGEASISSVQVPNNFSGDDYGAVLRRVQPISDKFALVPSVGYTSYDRPGGRLGAVNVGLGLEFALD